MEHSGISSRMMQKLAALQLRPPPHPSDNSIIDLSQAENSLLRNELVDIGKTSITETFNAEVSYLPSNKYQSLST